MDNKPSESEESHDRQAKLNKKHRVGWKTTRRVGWRKKHVEIKVTPKFSRFNLKHQTQIGNFDKKRLFCNRDMHKQTQNLVKLKEKNLLFATK